MIGKTISHYKILEKLGEGGMGVVYKAEDAELERLVALKFLTPQALGSEEEEARFAHEARSAAALDHPNICTVHEINKAEGHTFIAMAYVEGLSLKEQIESGPLGLDEALNTAIQVAEGLQEAHEKGIVHRDIKPANIMITLKGQGKIMDFGLAKSAARTMMTKDGTTLGTFAYMSPEQTRGEEVDGRSDIWSTGAVLYEMVTGQRAFKGDYEQAVVYSILNAAPEPPTALRTGVPMELERIVERCLAKDQGERYQTAADLVADLRHLKRVMAESTVHSRLEAGSWKAARSGRRWPLVAALVVIAALAVIVLHPYFAPSQKESVKKPTEQPVSDRKMLVVLPFENLGSSADEYFADGMTEEITARLAGIHGLGVIARTSAVQYRDTDKTVQQIGQELGVKYILEGTVRWQNISEGRSQVRVTPQLIKVSDATHLWADVYQKDMTDIFQVQSDIALRVAEALDVALLEPERRSLEARPTENPVAYEAYLRGLAYSRRPDYSKEDLELAVQMFDRAVELDPTFAVGYAELSKAHSILYHLGYDPTAERQAGAKVAVDLALELQPDLPEAHLALGYYYYWVRREYDRALEALAIAERGLPNDGRLLEAVAFIWRRQGRFEASLDKMKRAFELSPRDAQLALNIAFTNLILRRYAKAEGYYDRSISLAPDQEMAYVRKARNLVLWRGDIQGARTTLERMTKKSHPFSIVAWHELELYEGDYRGALNRLASLSVESIERPGWYRSKAQLAGLVYRLMDEPDQARSSFDSGRVLLEKELEGRPDDHRIHTSLGVVYAGLGLKNDAIREGKLGVELLPMSKDAVAGASLMTDLALIYVMVGEYDLAMEQIEYLLSIPSQLSVQMLRLDPRWNPLWELPRFQRLLEERVEAGP